MDYVLLVVQKPADVSKVDLSTWRTNLQETATSVSQIEGCHALNEGSFLLSLDFGARNLLRLLKAVDQYDYRLLFFEREPRWIKAGDLPSV